MGRQSGSSVLATIHAAAWLLAVATVPVQAQPSQGVGGVLCSQYSRAARSSAILYHQVSNWLLGYVSGINVAAKGASPFAGLTDAQVLKATGDYCEAHPASTIASAANEWSAALPKQAEAPAPPTRDSGMWLKLEPAKSRPLLERR